MKQLTPVSILSLLLVGVCLLLGCGRSDVSNEPIELKLTTVLPQGHPSADALEYFEQQVEALSDGRIDVTVFFSGQLGSAVETVELCRGGNIEIINCASSYLGQFLPIYKVMEMPFIFRDSDHQHAVLDGEIGSIFRQEVEALDLQVLAFFDAGSRNVMTKKGPITKPDDLSGLKIRVMPSPLLLSSINAIGASAMPMNQGEVYSALQMGVLDGWENNPPTTLNFRMYETGCIYYTRTCHSSIPDLLLMSQRALHRLPVDLQSIVVDAAKDTQVKQRELWTKAETDAEQKLQEAGMIFTTVDQASFKARIKSVYTDLFERYGERFESICQRISEVE